MNIQDGKIINNQANEKGGDVYIDKGKNVTVYNSVLLKNQKNTESDSIKITNVDHI